MTEPQSTPDRTPRHAPAQDSPGDERLPSLGAIPQHVIDAINLNVARRFVARGETLLHELVRYIGHPGKHVAPEHAEKFRDGCGSLRTEAEEGCGLLDELRALLDQNKTKEAAGLVAVQLFPLMKRFQGLLDCAHSIRAVMAEEADSVKSLDSARNRERLEMTFSGVQCSKEPTQSQRNDRDYCLLSSIVSTVAYDPACAPSIADLRALRSVVQCTAHRVSLRVADPPPSITANQEDIAQSALIVINALGDAADDIRNDLIRGPSGNGSEGKEHIMPGRELLQSLCVSPSPVTIYIHSGGAIEFSRHFPDEVLLQLMQKAGALEKATAPVRELAEFYNGSFEWRFNGGTASAVLSLGPLSSLEPACDAESCGPKDITDDAVMNDVVLKRRVTLPDGSQKTYKIRTQGAAFVSQEGYAGFCEALEYGDSLLELLPELDSLDLQAYGTAGDIEAAYSERNFKAMFYGPRVVEPATLHILHMQFPWEEDEAGAEKSKAGKHAHSHADSTAAGLCSLVFNEGLFGNEELLPLVAEVCKRARPRQLSMEHDIEAQRIVLPELCRVLDEVQAAIPGCELSFQLIPVVPFHTTPDELFHLKIYGSDGNLAAKGDFPRSTVRFQHRLHDSKLASAATDRIMSVIESLWDREDISFRRVDPALMQRGVELPEDLLMKLVEEAKECRENPHRNHALRNHITQCLEQTDIEISAQGETIKVTQPS